MCDLDFTSQDATSLTNDSLEKSCYFCTDFREFAAEMQNRGCLTVSSGLCVLIATAAFAVDPSEPLDEAMGGRTLKGTPVKQRLPECFPAEPQDVFYEMDQVVSGPGGTPQPLNFDADNNHMISDKERDAIRGRNTWLLWGEGTRSFGDGCRKKGTVSLIF